jgi:hypothetical protein
VRFEEAARPASAGRAAFFFGGKVAEMRWFKHFNDARRNPKLRAIERELGEAGYARAMKLLEIVAQVGGTGASFRPEIRLRKPTTSEAWLADELGIPYPKLSQTLTVFSRVGLIESRAWTKKIIRIPQMREYIDEWSRKDSRATPERLRSNYRATPVSEAEVRGQRSEAEAEKSKSLPLASASSEAKETPSTKRKTSLIGVN